MIATAYVIASVVIGGDKPEISLSGPFDKPTAQRQVRNLKRARAAEKAAGAQLPGIAYHRVRKMLPSDLAELAVEAPETVSV